MNDFVNLMGRRYITRVFDSAASKFHLLLSIKKVKFRALHVIRKFRHHLVVNKTKMEDLSELFWEEMGSVEEWEGNLEHF